MLSNSQQRHLPTARPNRLVRSTRPAAIACPTQWLGIVRAPEKPAHTTGIRGKVATPLPDKPDIAQFSFWDLVAHLGLPNGMRVCCFW